MRCFLAIELPAPIRHQLTELQQRLSTLDHAARWTKPEQIHLTIKFLGEVPDRVIPAICNAAKTIAAQFAPFDLEISGTGCFPPHGPPRIIWAGITNPPSTLLQCQQASEATYADQGYPPENRPYRLHLTIGRVNQITPGMGTTIRNAIREQDKFKSGEFTVDELVLFQSIQDRTGTTHIPIAKAPLRTPDVSRRPMQR